jgi:hypothetical protein
MGHNLQLVHPSDAAVHLRQEAAAPETSQQLASEVATVARVWDLWVAIRRRRGFRRRGFRVQRQLLLRLGSSFGMVLAGPSPGDSVGSLKNDPAWLQPFSRVDVSWSPRPLNIEFLDMVDVQRLFHRLNRSEGAAEVAVHQAWAQVSDVIHDLGHQRGPASSQTSASR